jgi:hypothetical protein
VGTPARVDLSARNGQGARWRKIAKNRMSVRILDHRPIGRTTDGYLARAKYMRVMDLPKKISLWQIAGNRHNGRDHRTRHWRGQPRQRRIDAGQSRIQLYCVLDLDDIGDCASGRGSQLVRS